MAHPFELPKHVPFGHRPEDRPTSSVLPCDNLIPGIHDIPYIKGDFLCYEERDLVEQTKEGKSKSTVERCQIHSAFATIWEPSLEDRACIAAGGGIQVLVFDKKQPMMSVNGLWVAPPAFPNLPIIEAIARTMYEVGPRSQPRWPDITNSEKQPWYERARKAQDIIEHWIKPE